MPLKHKRKSPLAHASPSRVCPNPECRNKMFKSRSSLHRHLIQKPNCHKFLSCPVFTQASCFDNNMRQSTTTTSHLHIPVPETTNTELNPTFIEPDDSPNAVDFENGVYSDEEETSFYHKNDYLIIPNDNIIFTNDMRIETSLLRICTDMDAPLWAFEEIMKWAQDAKQSGYEFSPKQACYNSQVQVLQKWLKMDDIRPIEKN